MKHILITLLIIMPITAALSQPDNRIPMNPAVGSDWRSGLLITGDLTGAFGLGTTTVPYSGSYYGISAQAGWQFTRNVRAGGGTGIFMHEAGPLLPLFLDARFNLNSQSVVPFISASGGAAFNPKGTGNRVWIFINPAAGVRFVTTDKIGISLMAGVLTMSSDRNRSSFINLRLGVEYKPKER